MDTCPKCGATKIEEGILRSEKSIGFVPENKKLLAGDTRITVYACLECGYMELYGDVEQIVKSLKSSKNSVEERHAQKVKI